MRRAKASPLLSPTGDVPVATAKRPSLIRNGANQTCEASQKADSQLPIERTQHPA